MVRRVLLPALLLLAAAWTTGPWLLSSWKLVDWLGGQPRWRRRVAVDGEWSGQLRTIRLTLPATANVFLVGDSADIESRRIFGAAVFHLYPIRTKIFGGAIDLEDARFKEALPDGVFVAVDPALTPTLRRLNEDELRPWPRTVIPFAADLRGRRDIAYRTRLTIVASAPGPLRLDFRRRGVGSDARRARIDLAAGETRTVENLLGDLFGQPGIAAVEIRANRPFSMRVELVATSGQESAATVVPSIADDALSPARARRARFSLSPAAAKNRWRFWGVNLGATGAVISSSWERNGRTGNSTLRLEPGGLSLIPDDAVGDWQGDRPTLLQLDGPPGTLLFASRRIEPGIATEMLWGTAEGAAR